MAVSVFQFTAPAARRAEKCDAQVLWIIIIKLFCKSYASKIVKPLKK